MKIRKRLIQAGSSWFCKRKILAALRRTVLEEKNPCCTRTSFLVVFHVILACQFFAPRLVPSKAGEQTCCPPHCDPPPPQNGMADSAETVRDECVRLRFKSSQASTPEKGLPEQPGAPSRRGERCEFSKGTFTRFDFRAHGLTGHEDVKATNGHRGCLKTLPPRQEAPGFCESSRTHPPICFLPDEIPIPCRTFQKALPHPQRSSCACFPLTGRKICAGKSS